MSTAGYPGTFPAGLTTGSLNIGAVQFGRTGFGYPGTFPAGLTTGTLNIGAVQEPVSAPPVGNTTNMQFMFSM